MSELLNFSNRELELAGYRNGDPMNEKMADHVLDLLRVFSDEEHSGFSASHARMLFDKLANFMPLSPLTGEDHEWTEVAEGVFQNKRYSGLFKQADRFDGQAYDINGKVFREPDGSCWTNADSFVPVEFPYMPNTEIVDVDLSEEFAE